MVVASSQTFAWGSSDVGRKRKKNEDNYTVALDIKLFVVADGMGGHKGGAEASRLAIETIEEIVRANQPLLLQRNKFDGPVEQNPMAKLLSDALRCACQVVHDKSENNSHLSGMGTTTTSLLLHQNMAFVAHVGDSRAYLLRDERLLQLSDDHSLVNDQVKAGLITEVEAQNSKLRNVITRSIGYEKDVDVDITALEIDENDVFLLCSDGLNTLVADEEIKNILLEQKFKEMPKSLIELANQRGGDDNTTVIVVYVPPSNRLYSKSEVDELEVARNSNSLERNLTLY